MDIWLQTGISSYDLGVNWLGLVVSLHLTTGLAFAQGLVSCPCGQSRRRVWTSLHGSITPESHLGWEQKPGLIENLLNCYSRCTLFEISALLLTSYETTITSLLCASIFPS